MFRLNQYEQPALSSCGGSCLPYLLVALLVVCGLVYAKAQEPVVIEPFVQLLPSYEERDTIVTDEAGQVYIEKHFISRIRVTAEYLEIEDKQAEDRRADDDRKAAKRAELRGMVKDDEKPPDRKSAKKPKQKKG
jgi:hypothetical protein